ncbi:MAG: hypothetical protein OXC46_03735 [Thaumarchaeota archaeon]|nr:hypothetical protein [Nitrososphaerota archaeon]
MRDNELCGMDESNQVRWLRPYVNYEWGNKSNYDIEQLLKSLQKYYHLGYDVDKIRSEILQRLSNTTQRKSTKPVHSTSDLSTSIKTLAKKIRVLETKISIQGSLIGELEFKANLTPHDEKIDEILNYTSGMFKGMDFVTGLYYIPLDDGTLYMIIIHNLDDRVKALELIQEKLIAMEDVFARTSFQLLLLHVSEVQPVHLLGAKQITLKSG